MEHGLAHNSHELPGLRQSCCVGSLPGKARKTGAGRGRPFHRIHQHHRLLRAGGPGFGAGTSVQPGLWQ